MFCELFTCPPQNADRRGVDLARLRGKPRPRHRSLPQEGHAHLSAPQRSRSAAGRGVRAHRSSAECGVAVASVLSVRAREEVSGCVRWTCASWTAYAPWCSSAYWRARRPSPQAPAGRCPGNKQVNRTSGALVQRNALRVRLPSVSRHSDESIQSNTIMKPSRYRASRLDRLCKGFGV